MNTFTIITTVTGLFIGGIGSWAGVRAITHSKSAPYDERQAELRADLRRKINQQFRLVWAVEGLRHGLPGGSVEEDLSEFRDYLNRAMLHLVAPSPAQLEVLIESIDDALAKLAVAHHVPRNDTVFLTHVNEIKANVLRPWLVRALDNINVLLDGLVEVERQPMSVRKQIRVFRKLDSKNQKAIEE